MKQQKIKTSCPFWIKIKAKILAFSADSAGSLQTVLKIHWSKVAFAAVASSLFTFCAYAIGLRAKWRSK